MLETRFVILEHDHPERHWDFMLEAGEVLRTWKLSMPPQVGQQMEAQLSFDHRLAYLDYEGPISGNRGSVVRWDAGTFTWERDEADQIEVNLEGKRFCGSVVLERGAGDRWLVIWGDHKQLVSTEDT